MGRRGWQAIEVPQGWFNVICGPRPPSVRWPQAQSSRQPVKVVRNASAATPAKVSVGRPHFQQSSGGVPVRKSGPAPTPEEVMERARRRATQLESAMQLLDAEDPALAPLQEALKKAKAQASAPPLADWVSASAEQLIEKTSRNAPNQRGSNTDRPPPMPSVVPAELCQWLLDRQSDLQDTLELGGPPDLVLQLTSMLSDGAVRMMEMNGGMVP